MSSAITRHFLPLSDGRQVHYRRAGSGPPLVIMHASPNSSASMAPVIDAFSGAFTCIALDTPGYGLSDDVVDNPAMLWGYADFLASFLDKLGIGPTHLYGAATGGQIGVQFARKYPARVSALVLDAIGDFSGENDILPGYFQDTTPVRDGSHLIKLWDMCRHLSVFFPWPSMRAADRIDADVASPQSIQAHVNDYLRAGPHYKKAYEQAILVERWENTRAVTAPVLMTRNAGGILVRHVDHLIAQGLPRNFTIVDCSLQDRHRKQFAALKKIAVDLPTPPAPPADTRRASTLQNTYLSARGGFLRARVNMAGEGPPILALHDPAGSSLLVEPILRPWIGRRPVIALDLPGNGESDNVIDPGNVTSAAYAEIVNEALASAGIDDVDVIGRYSGGPVAMEMSFQNPTRVRHLALSGIGIYEGDAQRMLLENYTPSIAPKWDGSHLMTAWAMMRDQALFWPWFNRTRAGIVKAANGFDVAQVHLRVTELLKLGDQYQKAYAAMWTYPMRERLPRLKMPALICTPSWDPVHGHMADLAAAAPQAKTAALPPAMTDWHRVLDPFFG